MIKLLLVLSLLASCGRDDQEIIDEVSSVQTVNTNSCFQRCVQVQSEHLEVAMRERMYRWGYGPRDVIRRRLIRRIRTECRPVPQMRCNRYYSNVLGSYFDHPCPGSGYRGICR